MMMKNYKQLKFFIFLSLYILNVNAQKLSDINEYLLIKSKFNSREKISIKNYPYSAIKLSYIQKFFLNSNLPNLENLNGVYLPKGFGRINSLHASYLSSHIKITAEPTVISNEEYPQNNSSAPSPVSATEYPDAFKDEKTILLGIIEVSSKGLSHISEVNFKE